MDATTHLDLPYIMPAQAQKHVTHNEALRMLDALVQLAVLDRSRHAPPAQPVEGDRYIVAGPVAEGEWVGRAGTLAAWQDGAWSFLAPRPGWLAFCAAENALLRFDGRAWGPVSADIRELGNLTRFGLGTTADEANPFTAKLNAALLTAATRADGGTGDLRFVVNKEREGDTATLLFQRDHSGRAEIGLAGTDDLQVKVSANGQDWRSGMTINRTTGAVHIPQGLHVEGPAGIGRAGQAVGGLYFNRATDNPFIVLSSGDPAAPTNIGQLRAQAAGNMIGLANATGAVYGVAYRAPDRVGILTTTPSHTLGVAGGVGPQTDNAHALGTSALRWSTVFAATGTINASDARDKIVDRPIAGAAARIVDAVEPVLFRWKIGAIDLVENGTERVQDGEDEGGEPIFVERPKLEEVPRPGTRLHAGWLAQEVKAALTAEGIDCGAWGRNDARDEESGQWLRPDQLVAFLWEALRQTRAELATVAARIDAAKA